jgi:iron only hydrogenase large subunit-like protein
MACPSGCTNGGGQIKREQYSEQIEASDILKKVEGSLHEPKDRVLGGIGDVQGVVTMLSDKYGAEWFKATFHPVDESDPMR